MREGVLAERPLAVLSHRDELDEKCMRRHLLQLRGRGQGQHLARIRIERHVLQPPLLHAALAEIETLQRIHALHTCERHPQATDDRVVFRADRAVHALPVRVATPLREADIEGASALASPPPKPLAGTFGDKAAEGIGVGENEFIAKPDKHFCVEDDVMAVIASLPADRALNVERIARAMAAWKSPRDPVVTAAMAAWAKQVVERGAAEYAEHTLTQRNDGGKRGINTKIREVVESEKKDGFLSSQLGRRCPEYADLIDARKQEHLDALILDGSIARVETRQRSRRGGKNYRLWLTKYAPEKALLETGHEVTLLEQAAS